MKQLRLTVLAFLGLTSFLKAADGKETLTEEQKNKIIEAYGQESAGDFMAALEKEGNGETLDANVAAGIALKMAAHTQLALANTASMATTLEEMKTEISLVKASNTDLTNKLTILSAKAEDDIPGKLVILSTGKWKPSRNGVDTYLSGEEQSFLAIDEKHPYNKRAYASLARRQGINIPVFEAGSLDYSSLATDLGDYYRVRKQDRIQGFLQELPSLTSIFGLESGFQDQATLVNLFITSDFSQADGTAVGSTFDNMVKGSFKFEAETITMYDVMFAHVFTQLKALEKQWIGYLNKEGAGTIKWSFIEFILVETAKKLKNEQELRRIRGVRKNPTQNVAGVSLQASNGLMKFLKNQISAFKMRPFPVGEWNSGTIVNYIANCTQLVPQVLRDSGRIVLYMSSDALATYNKALRVLWGENIDFAGPISKVFEYPMVTIKPIPGMAPSQRMIWTLEGNISLFEDVPGEMLNFNLEQKDWTLKVWSNWRESIWAYLVGRKFASLAEIPDDYSTQLIFCNDVDEPASYYIAMDKDIATPSVLNHTSMLTVANTGAVAFTNILDAMVGQEVRIKWGNVTNAPTIAQSGNFSLLPSAISAPALGDIIYLKKRSDGKFIQTKYDTIYADATAFAANATTPDVATYVKFITVANSGATAITSFLNATVGQSFTVYGGSNTNSSTIANSGNFVLTAAMTLSLAAYIVLQKSSDGKFYEITRG